MASREPKVCLRVCHTMPSGRPTLIPAAFRRALKVLYQFRPLIGKPGLLGSGNTNGEWPYDGNCLRMVTASSAMRNGCGSPLRRKTVVLSNARMSRHVEGFPGIPRSNSKGNSPRHPLYSNGGNHMNKWKSIQVVKTVRVVMKFQGAVALGVVMAVATPELLHRGAEPHTQHETPKGADQRKGKIALEAVTSGTAIWTGGPVYTVFQRGDNNEK
jgi:hypothetical protein